MPGKAQSLIVIITITVSIIIFTLFFIYLYRVYRRLQVRYAKPPPSQSIPPGLGLEHHQELAFVLAHGVEAYNQLRQQRLRREQQQQTSSSATPAPNNQTDNDSGSTLSASSHPSIAAAVAVEPPPAYSPTPVDGDVGYGWRVLGDSGLLAAPGFTSSAPPTGPGAGSTTESGEAPQPYDAAVAPMATSITTSHPLMLDAFPP
ncbi:hypothetical protein BGZ94_010056, partial [Podila epigama]